MLKNILKTIIGTAILGAIIMGGMLWLIKVGEKAAEKDRATESAFFKCVNERQATVEACYYKYLEKY